MRSGSSAFSELVANHTNRTHRFVNNSDLIKFESNSATTEYPDQPDRVYSTHTFELLQYVSSYKDPIIFRCARKDKSEQCLSYLFMKHLNHCRPSGQWVHNINSSNDANIALFHPEEPIYISKKEVIDYMRYASIIDRMWKDFTKDKQAVTVYYEDLCNGMSIPEIDLFDCRLDTESATKKLPDYKSRSILNESMIRKWVTELTQDFG